MACKLFSAGGMPASQTSPAPSLSPKGETPQQLTIAPTQGSGGVPGQATPVPPAAVTPGAPTPVLPLVVNGTQAPDICTSIPASFQALDGEQVQRQVDALSTLTSGLKFPQHLAQENAAKQGGEWDANQYFTVLTHLSLSPGSALDYVYEYLGAGGHPILYVRPADQPPYTSIAELDEAQPVVAPGMARLRYLDGIHAEDTPQGFLEYALLTAHGGQFYLYWHDGYFDDTTLATPAALEAILDEHSSSTTGNPMPSEIQQAARRVVLAPAVEMGADQVRVRLVSFSNWGGFSVQVYRLHRAFLHTPVQVETFDCVPYDIGIRF